MIDPELQNHLRAKYNPDGSPLRALQLRMLEMLKYIDEVCRANGIHYWLSSGTALGAVRHGGFIPWDDDADVEFLRRDYKKFRKAVLANPHPRFVLQDHTTDPDYPGVLAKLRDKDSIIFEGKIGEDKLAFNGAFIDLFCIEPSNTPKLTYLSHKIQLATLYRVGMISNKALRRTLLKINRAIVCGVIFPIMSAYGRIGNKSRLRHAIGSGFPKPRSLEDIKEVIYIPFEDTQLPVPKGYDSYLRQMFGDYMALPAEAHRETHIRTNTDGALDIKID